MRWLLLIVVALFLTGCSDGQASTTQAGPQPDARPTTPRPTPQPTAVNYVSLRQSLLVPLQSLIAAQRANDAANGARFLAEFESAAVRVLPVIEKDTSANANRLHSAIVNTREAAARKDLASLEAQRLLLLDVR